MKKTGPAYWRSLEHLAQHDQVRALVEAEFPGYDPESIRSLSRRRFMKIMGASLALAGLTLSGCRRWPKEKVAPYAGAPSNRVPGVPEQYATIMSIGGVAAGLLATSFDGRPVKMEGNPTHPYSRLNDRYGAADAFAQASVLELYDPDRSRTVVDRRNGKAKPSTWAEFAAWAKEHFGKLKGNGAGLTVLTEAVSGPANEQMLANFAAAFPQAKVYEWEAVSWAAAGAPRAVLNIGKARTIVSLDADLFGLHPAHVRYAADWAKGRKSADNGKMNRVLMAESAFSTTGTVADVRIGLRPSRVAAIAAGIASGLAVRASDVGLSEDEKRFVDAAIRCLKEGDGVVAVGEHLPADVQGLVHAINEKIGAIGQTVRYLAEPQTKRGTIAALAEDVKAGRVQTLVILGGNPAYDAPSDLGFGALLAKVPNSVHLSLYNNETSIACKWHVPRAHYLEGWGDGRAWDGTVSIQQPLIQPLYDGKSSIELLAVLCGEDPVDAETIVRSAARLDEKAWRRALHDGVVEGSGFKQSGTERLSDEARKAVQMADGLELRFLPDAKVYDGRFANSGWLQEMPDPLTKLTWDNAALISKKDADALRVKTGDVVRISVGSRSIEIVAYILPGQPVGVIGLPLGYGRKAAGNVGNGVGVDVYPLRTSDALWAAGGAKVEKTGRTYALAMTQDHHIIDEIGAKGRAERVGEKGQSGPIVREATLDHYREHPHFVHEVGEEGAGESSGEDGHGKKKVSLQLFQTPSKFNTPHAWGMAVDMASCIGCNACVVACQAENNIPVVGKDQVAVHREMHWIRVDRYFKGSADDPSPAVVHQPMMCQHCETAPCEQVCPVTATVHDTEGLNTMVYNRCVGTRYCSNNCPYKVRRFNYFDFHSKDPRGTAKPWLGMPDTQQRETIDKIKQMVFNPDVTVRMRGVMEKCTYCVQRIKAAEIAAENHGEKTVKDGAILTACQQTCPTEAIVFGNLNDPNSKVSQLHRSNRAYAVLSELNTRPRTAYLARISNPAEGGVSSQ